MIAYADASALVKRYADEPGAGVLEAFDGLLVSCLSEVEVASAIWRARREGRVDDAGAQTLVATIAAAFHGGADQPGALAPIAVGARVIGVAAGLGSRHPLRAGDAIQLASALAARDAEPRCEAFVCFDRQLRTAAAAEGFRLVPA